MKPHPVPKLKLWYSAAATLALLAGGFSAHAQFAVDDWPSTIDSNAAVDYAVFDPTVTFASTPGGWGNNISLASGGDQAYELATLDGLLGDQGTSSFLNIADANYTQFATVPVVDVLLQVFGNDALYNNDGTGKTVTFNEGILGTEYKGVAGTIPLGANNSHWNWMLFTITNPVSPNVENTSGLRYIGFQASTVPPGAQNGGVNGGTLRLEGLPGIAIRVAAIGPAGSFGTSNAINVFLPPPQCDPEPAVNLAYIDVNANDTNHLMVLNDQDQTVTYQSNVGPTDDKRKAVQANGGFMNFGILDNYLGVPCNPPRAMKVCVEFYDDPALAGVSFGPEAYATDDQGNVGTYNGPMYTLTGSGRWLRLAFWVPAVNLYGVNTSPLTGGTRLSFNGGYPFIDRVELGVVRTGTNALAGLDPDPTFYLNPLICTTNYGYYVELDLNKGITNGLDIGSSGGDQNMVIEQVGPTDDLRWAEAPSGGNNNIQFAIIPSTNGLPPLGPTYQDNADILMALTYYDDPAMAGARFYPWPYNSLKAGVSTTSFPNQLTGTNVFGQPYDYRETLTGSGTWKVAYFELPNVNLAGINQGPQSVARFQTDSAVGGDPSKGYVHISRVQYCVVRPCGSLEGINVFQKLGFAQTLPFNLQWQGSGIVQASATLLAPNWADVFSSTNPLGQMSSYSPATTNGAGYYRLTFPPSPQP
ncbi:MAG TPA: hypothetical protein VL527_00390 [Dongiaceae bacterium]|nr:hypothetical protein [Dongiaceae bacterium]